MNEISWLVEKRLLLLKMHETSMSDEQWTQHFDRVRSVLAEGLPPIHMIVDLSEQTSFLSPAAARRFSEGIKQGSPSNENPDGLGWTVVITHNLMIRFVGSLLTQWTGGKMRPVTSLEEALAFLTDRDQTLPQNIKHEVK